MNYELYKIQNKANNKHYIGITTQGWNVRCLQHKSDARNGCDFKLHRAIRKYGVENFDFQLLEKCSSIEELKEREAFWINLLKTMDDQFGYNMTAGGDGTFGRMHSDETKKKLSDSALKSDSMQRMPVQIKGLLNNEEMFFKSNRKAAIFLGIPEQTLYNRLITKGKGYCIVKEYEVIRREDLKPEPKPKKTKRSPEQIESHMKLMQEKSTQARKDDNSWKAKIRKTKGFKIVQQFKDDILIAEYEGVRDAVQKNDGFKRSGIQHCLKGRNLKYKGYIWKHKQTNKKDDCYITKNN